MADDVASRIEQYKLQDGERHEFVESLYRSQQENVKELAKVTSDLEIMQGSCRSYHERIKKLEAELKRKEQASFVLVLLDADTDGYFFEDPLIAKGLDGGIEAANKLRGAVREELHTREPGLERIPCVIKAYIFPDGVREAFHKARLGHVASRLSEFITGFNQVSLCEFVCVGSGKDRADEKIRNMFELFLENSSCRHIAFAACHDNGYPRFLEQIHDELLKSKITLIEGFFTGRDFQKLGIHRTKVKGVFRSGPLVIMPDSTVPATGKGAQQGQNGVTRTYSSAISGTAPPSSVKTVVASSSANVFTAAKIDARRRLDQKIKGGSRFCISFLLRGEIHDPGRCGYSHGADLTQEELELWKTDQFNRKFGY